MAERSLRDEYIALFEAHVAGPKKKHLAAAAGLGRELLLREISEEDVAEMHEEALRRVSRKLPEMPLRQAALLITAPLLQMLMAYGRPPREQLQARLRHLQKMATIGELAVGAAHDFNNVLTGIIGLTHLLFMQAKPGSRVHGDLTELRGFVNRAAGLTRQLLSSGRRQTPKPVVLNLDRQVGNMTRILGRLIGEDIDLKFLPDAGQASVRADPGQIEQVLMNLAMNARDAMPHGGELTIETAQVTLDQDGAEDRHAIHPSQQSVLRSTTKDERCCGERTRSGPYVMLAVTDTGSGMDEATQRRIFEPFFTTKELGEGTGLGLARVYGIVKQHDGDIRVHTEPGKGTIFRIYLPSVAAKPRHAGAKTRYGRGPRGSETILLVEDEGDVRAVMARALEELGYTVLSASSPGDAEALFTQGEHQVALLLTDVVMPGRNGRDLYERLAARRPSLKVLYMSGYAESVIAHYGVLDPGAAFVAKPFDPDTLARRMRQALDAPKRPNAEE